MNFELNDDQQMIKALVERFVAEHYQPGARAANRAGDLGYRRENWTLLAETGVLALPFPAASGGMDGGAVEIAAIMEVFGRGLVTEPFLAEILIAGGILAATGTDAQKDAWLPAIIAGERHIAFAFAEHGTRYDLHRARTTFGTDGLVGGKTFVSANADAYIVTATENGRIGLYLAEAGQASIACRDYRLIDGSLASEIVFSGANAEPLARGMEAIAPTLDLARLAAAAEMIGLIGYLFDTTIDYVRQRRQFKAPIGSFQAIQHRLADGYAIVELARSQLLRAMLAPPEDRAAAIAGAKAYVSGVALRIAEESVQLHGGMGISEELDIGAALKRVLLLSTLFGDAEHETRRYNAALREAA